MSFFVSAPQEAFRLVMDYFTGRHMKILTSNSPSYIKAEIGAWFSMSLGNEKGEVEAEIVKRNGGSYVNLNFSFLLTYVYGLLIAFIPAVITYIVLKSVPIPIWFVLGNSLLSFLLVMGIIGYDVSKTRRYFIEEFNMFIQSLASKKA